MSGAITRREIIEDEAIKWGDEYAKNIQLAIDKNKEFVASILALNEANLKLRDSRNDKELQANQKTANELSDKSITIRKEQIALETSFEKMKQEAIKTEKASIDLMNKKSTQQKQNIKLTADERLQNELNNRALKEQAIAVSPLVGAYQKLNLQRTQAKKNLQDLLSAENKNIDAIKRAEREFATLDKRVRSAEHAVGDFNKTVGNYPKLSNLTSGIKNLVGAFGVVGGITLLATTLTDAFKTIKKFEQGVADLSAITGATGKDLQFLKNQAIELGKGVKGGAAEVVESFKLIASAKPELLENVQALNQVTEAVITLAQASGMEMPDAAIALTDAMNQFGAGAEEATRFIDALANGAKFGSAEIPQVTEALLKFGAVARSSNVSIEESTALIELLAENGLKGADAGTALRNVLLKISAPDALPRKATEEFAKLGISLETLKDKSIPIQDKLELLKPLLKDNASVVKIFGLENATAAINVLGHTGRLKELTAKMSENGTATQQAKIRMDTLTGSVDLLASSWDSFVLSLSEKGNGAGSALKWLVDDLKDTIEYANNLFTSKEKLRERELAEIRKEGLESAQKNFNSKKKLDDDQLKEAMEWNNSTIAENTRLGKALSDTNAKILADESKTLFQRKQLIKKNQQEIAKLNDDTVFNQGQNAGINSILKSRQPAKASTDITSGNAGTGKTDKENADAEKLMKEKLSRAKKLNDSLFELEKQRLERSIKLNNEVANDEKVSDDVRIKALEAVQEKEIALAELTKKHSLDADKFVLEADKLNANQKLLITNETENKIFDIKQESQKKIEKINEFDFAKYQKDIENKVKVAETAMNKDIAAENQAFKEKIGKLGNNQKLIEEETVKHEERLFKIKNDAAIAIATIQADNLQSELDAFKAQSDGSKESVDFIADIEHKLYEARRKLTELGLETFKAAEEEKVKTAKEKAIEILQISQELTSAISDLGNAFSQRKIQNIDNEIQANEDYYNREIKAAGTNEALKTLLEKERERKRDVLEKKKKKAEYDAAVFQKAVTVAQIGLQTALAIIAAAATSAPTFWAVAIAAAIGAIQLTAAIATPIPKYKLGRKDGPEEFAIVGDGGRREVIERKTGNIEITPASDTLVKLFKGDKVHSSIEDYRKIQKASIMASIGVDNRKYTKYVNSNHDERLLEEMQLTRKAIEKMKTNVTINVPENDPAHEAWKAKNRNWNK